MAIYKFNLPLTDEQVKSLKVGDNIYVTGNIVTARDDAHKHALAMYDRGETLPVDFKNLGIYHAGPIMAKNENDEWYMVAGGPTTSNRIEIFQDTFIEAFGSNLIIGKGGMGGRTTAAMHKFGAVYGMFTGGAALLAANQVKEVVEVHWFDAQTSTESMFINEIEQHLKPIYSKSVGYLLIDKPDFITLGFLVFGNGLIKHHQVIPRGMIKKIEVIRNGYKEIVKKKVKVPYKRNTK